MNKRIQSLSLMIGSLLSVAIVCAQLFHFQGNTPSKKEVRTEQQETNSPEGGASFSIASFSLPAPVHISVNLDACCLFEILFEKTPECQSTSDSPLYPKKFFITLFRVIISPNAP